ncbi:MAG: SDR family oxidoreductase [Promethearchaeota archaeon]
MRNPNSKNKILILGARGYLGSFLIKYAKDYLPEEYELIISARDQKHLPKDLPFYAIDITNKRDLIEKIEKINPQIVINSAAISLPDYAEQHKEETYKINVEGVANIVEACSKINAKLIHISTDYVFSDKGNYKEDDEYSPVNYYGFTKAEAEKVIKKSNLIYLILRPSFLYGTKKPYQRPNNFYNIYNKLKEGKKVKATSQMGCPTLVDDLAITIYKMLDFHKSEIYHTAGEPMSRFDFAVKIAEVFDLNKDLIEFVEVEEKIAPRPKNTTLDCSKLERDYGIRFRSVEDSLKFIKSQIHASTNIRE